MKRISAVVIITLAIIACAATLTKAPETVPKIELINFDKPIIIDIPIYRYAFAELEVLV